MCYVSCMHKDVLWISFDSITGYRAGYCAYKALVLVDRLNHSVIYG